MILIVKIPNGQSKTRPGMFNFNRIKNKELLNLQFGKGLMHKLITHMVLFLHHSI